jgi:hypothetical protein
LRSSLVRLISFSVLVVLLRLAAAAQQPDTPAQAPPPPDSTQSTQPPPAPKKSEPPDAPSATQERPKEGKSELEKETGTINDRILTVMPNYGTVENAHALPPISSKQKFRLATAGVFDYFAFPFDGALAAIDQAKNSPASWGQGWGAYGKRYGATFADNSIGTYMTTAIFPSMLHEDPRYYQLGQGSVAHRTFYSISRLVVARTDSGHSRFNYSELFGNALAAGISNVYHAPEDRTFGRNLSTLGELDMWDGLSNLMKEFWPDVHRKMQHKHNTTALTDSSSK